MLLKCIIYWELLWDPLSDEFNVSKTICISKILLKLEKMKQVGVLIESYLHLYDLLSSLFVYSCNIVSYFIMIFYSSLCIRYLLCQLCTIASTLNELIITSFKDDCLISIR